MKKILTIMFVLGVMLVTVSMFANRTKVEPKQNSLIENSNLGYSDIPEDNGL